MKKKLVKFLIVGILSASSLSAQDIINNNPLGIFDSDLIPFTATLSVNGGYDTNAGLSDDEENSPFASVGLAIGKSIGTERTPISFSLRGQLSHFFEDYVGKEDDIEYSGGLAMSLGHQFNERLAVTDILSVSYGRQPGFSPYSVNHIANLTSENPSSEYTLAAGSISRNSSDYIVGANNLSLTYKVSERIHTSFHYGISTTLYDETELSEQEDRFSHSGGVNLSYIYSPTTSYTLNYRGNINDYDTADRDYITHNIGLGITHRYSEYVTLDLNVGVTLADSDVVDSQYRPSGSLVIPFYINPRTNLSWANTLGYDGNELSDYGYRYSYRSALRSSYELSERINVNGTVSFIWSDLIEGIDENTDDINEIGISAGVGLSYLIFENTSFNLGYTFSTFDSDDSSRNYDARHRIAAGLNIALF